MTLVDQAENIGGVVSAARQRERWMREMANTSDDEKREALRDAIGTLEVKYPDVEDLGPGEAERFARERGHGKGARSPSHEGRTRHRPATKRKPPAKQRPKSTPSPPAKKQPAAGGKTGRDRAGKTGLEQRLRGRGRQALRETRIPAAGSSVSRIAMSALGATVGLAAAYLLLNSAERGGAGGEALPGLLEAITGFLRRIVAPVDFFGPQLTQKAYSRAIAGPNQRQAERIALPQLPPPKHASKVKTFHVKPAELGFGSARSHKRR